MKTEHWPHTRKELETILDRVIEVIHGESRTRYASMTYEQGIREALEWVLGDTDDSPYAED